MRHFMKPDELKSGMFFQPRGQHSLYLILALARSDAYNEDRWSVAWLNRSATGPGIELTVSACNSVMSTDELVGWIGTDSLVGYWDRMVSFNLIVELAEHMEI